MSDRIGGCSAVAEILAEIAHVQHADARLVHLGHRHAVHVQDGELQLVRGAGEAAAAMPPRSGQHGKAGHRPEQHRAVAMVLGADERPQQRRLRRGVLARESLDVVRRQADRVRHALGGVLPDALRQRLVADRVLRDVVVIHEAVADDDVHHRERKRRVAGRLDRQGASRPIPPSASGPDRPRRSSRRAAAPRARTARSGGS